MGLVPRKHNFRFGCGASLVTLICLVVAIFSFAPTARAADQCDPNKFVLIGDSVSDGLARAMGIGVDWGNPSTMMGNKYDAAFPGSSTRWFISSGGESFPSSWPDGTTPFKTYLERGITPNQVLNRVLSNTDAKVAIIMFGTNDCGGLSLSEFKSNLKNIIATTKSHGLIPVLSTIPPRSPSFKTQCISGGTEAWNNAIREVASSEGIQLRDAFAAMQDPSILAGGDGVHPTRYTELVNVTKSTLTKVCGGSTTGSESNSSGSMSCSLGTSADGASTADANGKTLSHDLGSDIDYFLGQGAIGYLVWQYSNTHIAPLGNDQYSFWQDDTNVCATLKTKAAQYPDKFIGVNMWDVSLHPDQFDNIFGYLSKSCGVTMIRISSRDDGAITPQKVDATIKAAAGYGLKVIVQADDFPNIVFPSLGPDLQSRIDGTPGYYAGAANDSSAYQTHLKAVVDAIKGNSNLYALEVMGEPHCASNANCVAPYVAWAHHSADNVKKWSGGSIKVGLGQAAASDNGRGDSPAPGDFAASNDSSSIDLTSGHYYDDEMRAVVVEAMGASKSLGKPFFIGEAPPSVCQKKGPQVYVYPGIDDQKNGDGTLDATRAQDAASHYMLTCGPQLDFVGGFLNGDDLNKPSTQKESNGVVSGYSNHVGSDAVCPGDEAHCRVDVVGTTTFDDGKTTIPLFRYSSTQAPSTTSDSRRYDDLEGFFAAIYSQNQGGGDPFITPLANGVYQKLLSNLNKCQDTLHFLETIKTLCNNQVETNLWNNPGASHTPSPTPSTLENQCPLDLKVAAAGKTYLEILNAKPSGFTCQWPTTFTGGASPTMQSYIDYENQLGMVEQTTPKAYKPAYIVRYVNAPREDPTVFNKIQNWFSPDGTTVAEKLKSRIKIDKVYVPAGFSASDTDKSLFSGVSGTTHTSPFINAMKAITAKSTQDDIEKLKTEEIADILTRSQTSNIANPDPDTNTYLNCHECGATAATLEDVLVRRINAETNRVLALNLKDTHEDYNCMMTDVTGEQAKERSTSINPDGNPDPAVPQEIKMKATLMYDKNKPKDDPLSVRTYLLLPEEYRNIAAYEDVLINTFLPRQYGSDLQRTFSLSQITNAKADQNYKFLQLSGTKVTSDDQESHSSSPIGDDYSINFINGTQTHDANYLKATIAEPSTNATKKDPLTPGGKLARGLWEIMCHVTQPFKTGKAYAPYQGFEKFLKEGIDSCYVNSTSNPASTCDASTSAPTATISCNNWRPGINSVGWSSSSQSWSGWTASTSEGATACSSSGSQGTGQSAQITNGTMALAVKVGKATCTPAEILIGMMAKESRGLAEEGKPYSGEAGEIGTRNCAGDALDPRNNCGPFSYNNLDINGRFQHTPNQMRKCLESIGLSGDDHDQRKLGVSLCAAGVQMWAASQSCSGSEPACDGSEHLEIVNTDASQASQLPQGEINAIMVLHANACGPSALSSQYANALVNYVGFIDQYKYAVANVRSQTKSCNND